MAKTSIKAAVRDAKALDLKTRKAIPNGGAQLSGVTADSFVNFGFKMGIGADNPLTSSTYGYNPITRNRILLEWIHRGSWLGGVAVDLVADDMTRAGVDFLTELQPDQQEALENQAVVLNLWGQINETIKWSRLYGGSIGVLLVDGQDPMTPFRLETVGPDQFKGLLVLDRWMVEPSLEDLVTEYGPHLGLPKYYRVQANSPALRGSSIHHSRVAFRLEGVQLPHQQRLTENMWGISVLERLYDRMVAFDSASTGAAQLVYKSYLRTFKIKGLRDVVSAGGAAMNGLLAYTEVMRRYQGIEGMTLIDAEDDFEIQGHQAFSGLGDALNQFGQQLSGALQIPLTRLFGQSPTGLNSTGESDLRMYYDNIRQQQRKTMTVGVTTCYQLMARSKSIALPDTFAVDFASLMELDDTQKAEVASKVEASVSSAFNGGLIGRQTGLRELRQSSRVTGVYTNISQETIEAADDEVLPPMPEGGMPGDQDGPGGPPVPGAGPDKGGAGKTDPAQSPKAGGDKKDNMETQGDLDGKPGSKPKAITVDSRSKGRVKLQHSA